MLDEPDHPFVRQTREKVTNVGIEYPVHLLPHDSHPQRVQCLMRIAPGPEPVGEAQEVLFVNLVEDCRHRLLDDLVLQGGNAEGTLSSVSFRYVDSPGRLRSIGSPMDAA